MALGPRLFMWLAGQIGRGIPFRSTNEHVPTLLELANRVPHRRILGLIGGADQLFSFLCLDPIPDEIVGFDASEIQLALARSKARLITRLDFGDYRDFATHRMPAARRQEVIARATEGLSLPDGFRENLGKSRLLPWWGGRSVIPWLDGPEAYARVREHVNRVSFFPADLGRPADFEGRQDFDLVYLSNVLRWCYSSRDVLLPPGEQDQPSNPILRTMDRCLKPEGRFLFVMNVVGRPSQPLRGFEDQLVLTAPSENRLHRVFAAISFLYSLAPRATRVRFYSPLPFAPGVRPRARV